MADIYNTSTRIEKELDKVNYLSPYNRSRMIGFIEKMRTSGMSNVQLLKYLQAFRWFSETCQKDLNKVTKQDLEKFMSLMNGKSMNTKKIRYYSLKKLFDHIGKKKLFEEYNFKFNGLNIRKLPEAMFTPEDIEKLINACNQTSNNNLIVLRNQAIIGVLYETGCRIGEFLNIQIKHVEFDNNGCVLRLSGKTGDRRVRIVNYSSLLQNYLSVHPNKDNHESLLWIKPNNNGPIGYGGVNKILNDAKGKSGIQKKIHPHILRHSRASHLAKFLTEQELKVFFGWSGGSDMASIYVHLSGADVDAKVLKSYGIESNGHSTPIISPKFCPQCSISNSSLQQFCKNCGSSLDKKQAVQMEKLENVLIKFFKVMGEAFPQSKEEFRKIIKEEGLEL